MLPTLQLLLKGKRELLKIDMIDWILLLLGFSLTTITAYISFSEKSKEYKKGKEKSKNYVTLFWVAVLGGLLTLASTWNSKFEESRSSKLALALNDSLISSQRLNTSLLLEQKDSTTKIMGSQFKLLEASEKLSFADDKIQTLQSKLIDNITGNGNVPVLSISPALGSKTRYVIGLIISNIGKTPIRGLKAQFTDSYSKIDNKEVVNDNAPIEYLNTNDFDALKDIKRIDIGDLTANCHEDFYTFEIPSRITHIGFYIKILWDNGFYVCHVQGEKANDKVFPKLKLVFAGNGSGNQKTPKYIQINNSDYTYPKPN